MKSLLNFAPFSLKVFLSFNFREEEREREEQREKGGPLSPMKRIEMAMEGNCFFARSLESWLQDLLILRAHAIEGAGKECFFRRKFFTADLERQEKGGDPFTCT